MSINLKPLVAIVMGSDSDLPTMQDAATMLDKFDIDFEIDFVSAHRTPHKISAFAKDAEKKGIKAIIAGAGGAAHLPGMIASETVIPVIGVPVKSRISVSGMDSLLSIVQMPTGVPVATVGIDRADNAGILAAQIVATGDTALAKRLRDYKEELRVAVEAKSEKLHKVGTKKYLEDKK